MPHHTNNGDRRGPLRDRRGKTWVTDGASGTPTTLVLKTWQQTQPSVFVFPADRRRNIRSSDKYVVEKKEFVKLLDWPLSDVELCRARDEVDMSNLVKERKVMSLFLSRVGTILQIYKGFYSWIQTVYGPIEECPRCRQPFEKIS